MRPLEILTLPTLALRVAPLALIAAAAPSGRAQQITFSVDWKGPTVGQPASGTPVPITEGDLLNPGSGAPAVGLQPRPSVRYTGAVLGLPMYSSCAGHPGGTPCGLEVDALSEGTDEEFQPSPALPGRLWFSVDKFAVGVSGTAGFPQVSTERLGGDASADLFTDAGLPPGPVPPLARVNVGAIDGDGVPSVATGFVYPGLGLQEPSPATPGPLSAGDNLDGLDIGSSPTFPPGGIFFSLDGALLDSLATVPGSNSAQANGAAFRPGDVLRTTAPGATPVRYATAAQLGLDLFGPGSDDLDALILVENGDGVFQPSTANYDWLPTGSPVDMLMFSVRRDSAVVGQPDSIFGFPIEPGDILVPPRPGGLSPFPGIWIAAEALGLATTRSGTAPAEGDDVDALDYVKRPYYDCNHNGIEDSIDIAVGSSMDANGNGIPDECENDKMEYCFCLHEYAPCGNGDPYPGASAGCRNSTGLGATLAPVGSTSVATDDLQFDLDRLPPNKPCIVILSPNTDVPATFGDGALCLKAPVFRYFGMAANGAGHVTFGPGLIGWANAHFPPLGNIAPGSTMHLQGWYRDPFGPCGSGKNLTNAARINFVP